MSSWVRCELPKETADRFKRYCRDNNIKFEPSEMDNHIHFECYMSSSEMAKANEFIEEVC